jgi:predicted nucleotidyltransferase component of viral defense system
MGIKVDFCKLQISLLNDFGENKVLSTKDIAAMKLNAIAGRGSKKDFIDLYFFNAVPQEIFCHT